LLAASGITGVVLAVSVVVVAAGFMGPPTEVVNNNHPTPEPPPVVPTPEESIEPPPPTETIFPQPQPEKPPAEATTPEATLPPVPMPQPMSPEDPLNIAEKPEQPAEKPIEPSKVFGSLEKFNNLLDNNVGAPRDPRLDQSPPPAIPVDTTDDGDDKPERPPVRHIDVTARLHDPLLAIDAEAVPLYDFLQQMTELSTIPITLRPEGLAMLKKTPSSPIAVKLENTTVGQAIGQAITPLFFEAVTVDEQIVVRFKSEMRDMKIQMGDLAKTEPQDADTLMQHVTTLFDPDSWGEGKDKGVIDYAAPNAVVRQRPLVLWQIVELCERLRAVRSLPMATGRTDNYFRTVSRWDRGRAVREKKVALSYAHTTKFTAIVERLAASAKVKILIDWQSLSELGWTPDTETTLAAENSTLQQALDDLTGPMECAWRVIDEQTLEITSPAALAELAEIELYPLPVTKDDDAAAGLIEDLKANIPPAVLHANGGVGDIRFDPAAKCLISYLPQPQQRVVQEALAKGK
jgi:hypothetical protein